MLSSGYIYIYLIFLCSLYVHTYIEPLSNDFPLFKVKRQLTIEIQTSKTPIFKLDYLLIQSK